MNVIYAKSILYAYSNIDLIIDQIDELVMKKALSSMSDYSPAILQCEKIVDLTYQKDLLAELKRIVMKVLSKFTETELDFFDYKYFKKKPKEYYKDFDYQSRNYFRRQIRLANLFAERLEKCGITDKRFQDEYLRIEFFKELLKRVMEYEILSCKNKGIKNVKKPKTVITSDADRKIA
ncbi:MAG: hypothetical protein IJR66_05615 [Clostridia bacterium]|nr:hypothetical protein [Clostridia bacterium]